MKLQSCIPLVFLTAFVSAEVENEIPLGIEVVTGYRSEYIQRGFKWANPVIDVQAEAEIALSDDVIANFGAWYTTAAGSGDFSEAAASTGIRREHGNLTLALDATWRTLDHSVYNDGLDIAPSIAWRLTDDLEVAGGLAWDTGADGLYAFAETRWSHPLGTTSFVSADAGLSCVSDYYDRSGLNDLYARVSYTRILNRSVSITPFVGTSVPLQSDGETGRLFGGLWFEVNF